MGVPATTKRLIWQSIPLRDLRLTSAATAWSSSRANCWFMPLRTAPPCSICRPITGWREGRLHCSMAYWMKKGTKQADSMT